ncbi:MAG TPA: D-alanine--D-alanine ligase A, partial [Clostridiales bacterium]|nr:D-alanine--D-alanine ligase A [Clostridiales bacterium]
MGFSPGLWKAGGVLSGRRKLRVGVIFGGRSGEHEVSLMSARSILQNLNPDRYEIIPIGITKEGRWVITDDPFRALEEGLDASGPSSRLVALLGDPAVELKLVELPGEMPGEVGDEAPGPASGPEAAGREAAGREAAGPAEAPVSAGSPIPGRGPALPVIDVVFPVLHGPYGEDGTIQGLLELAGLPYVGAGVLPSACAMDKGIMKDLFVRHGLPVLDYVVFKRKEWQTDPEAVIARITSALPFPVFIKPCNLGSSVGITKVHHLGELAPAIEDAARYDRRLIAERGLEGAREIECSVLGNDEPEVSVCGEILPSREFYDYNAKYVDGTSGLIIPADIPEDVSDRVRDLARRAFLALDGNGMARADFLVSRD